MPSLKEIKLRIKSIKTTQKTTRAMKMISAARLRKAQDNLVKLRPYANKLNEILGRLLAALEGSNFQSPYMEQREVKNVLIVVVSSDRGLAGAFNSAIIRIAENLIADKYTDHLKAGKLELLTIGKKGFEFFRKRNFSIVGVNREVFQGLNFNKVEAVAEEILEGFTAGRWDIVELVYNEFKNISVQNRIAVQYLPVLAPAASDAPTGGKAKGLQADYIYEPGQAEILTALIPQILKMRLFRAVLESNVSEHGARMFAMDNATENAEDLLGKLRLSYNKARQAAITKEIIEIVGGAEALNG